MTDPTNKPEDKPEDASTAGAPPPAAESTPPPAVEPENIAPAGGRRQYRKPHIGRPD